MITALRRGALAALALVAPLAAQAPAAPAGPATTPTVPAANSFAARDGWTSDRRALRVGDLLTVVVGERVTAEDRTSQVARSTRSQRGTLDGEVFPADLSSIGLGHNAQSDQTGRADRRGTFDATLTVRIAEIEPTGIVRIEGTRLVSVDGRKQEMTLSGLVRPEDISPRNVVASHRIANAEILYKGKKVGPKTGLFGKLLAAFWP